MERLARHSGCCSRILGAQYFADTVKTSRPCWAVNEFQMRANCHESVKYPSALGCGDTTISSLSNVGIGITTKDRWEDLEATLTVLEEKGFSALETIVIDDGSLRPAPPALRERFPWVRFERSDRSYGLIVQRNRLARMLTSAYYLSLDDDSFPAAGDLGSAVQFLEGKPDTLGLAFSIILRDEVLPELGPNSLLRSVTT